MLILYFHIFRGCFEVLKSRYFKHLCIHTCYQCVLQHTPLLVAELLIYCNKYFLIKSRIKNLTLFKNPYLSIANWFLYSFNSNEATLKQR